MVVCSTCCILPSVGHIHAVSYKMYEFTKYVLLFLSVMARPSEHKLFSSFCLASHKFVERHAHLGNLKPTVAHQALAITMV